MAFSAFIRSTTIYDILEIGETLKRQYSGLIFVCIEYHSIHACDRLEDLVLFCDWDGYASVSAGHWALLVPQAATLDIGTKTSTEGHTRKFCVPDDVAHKLYTQMAAQFVRMHVEKGLNVSPPQGPSKAFQQLMHMLATCLEANPPPSSVTGIGCELSDSDKRVFTAALARLRNYPYDAVKKFMWAVRYTVFEALCKRWNDTNFTSTSLTFKEFKLALSTNTLCRDIVDEVWSAYCSMKRIFERCDFEIANVAQELATTVDATQLSQCISKLREKITSIYSDMLVLAADQMFVMAAAKKSITSTPVALLAAFYAVNLREEAQKILATGRAEPLSSCEAPSLTAASPIEAFWLLRSGLSIHRTKIDSPEMNRAKNNYGCYIMLHHELQSKDWGDPMVQVCTVPHFVDTNTPIDLHRVDTHTPIVVVICDDFTRLSGLYDAGYRPLVPTNGFSYASYRLIQPVASGKVPMSDDIAVKLRRCILETEEERAAAEKRSSGTAARIVLVEASPEEKLAYERDYDALVARIRSGFMS